MNLRATLTIHFNGFPVLSTGFTLPKDTTQTPQIYDFVTYLGAAHLAFRVTFAAVSDS